MALVVETSLKTISNPRTHYGDGRAETRSFLLQRLTGAVNIALTIFLVWFVVSLAGTGREAIVAGIRSPWVWAPLALLVVNVPIHMRIGMREVIEDYVHEPRLNRFALMANTYVAIVVAIVGLVSILKLAVWG